MMNIIFTILLFLFCQPSAADIFLEIDSEDESHELFTQSLNFSFHGMHSLLVEERLCELDPTESNHAEIYKKESEKRRASGGYPIAFFVPCEVSKTVNIENYTEFEFLSFFLYKEFDFESTRPVWELTGSLSDDAESELSLYVAFNIKNKFGIEGYINEVHHTASSGVGEITFSVGSLDEKNKHRLISVFSRNNLPYVLERRSGENYKADWEPSTIARQITSYQKSPFNEQAIFDSSTLDKNPELVAPYFLENVAFYLRSEFESGRIGAPLLISLTAETPPGPGVAIIDLDSMSKVGDSLFYTQAIFFAGSDPSRPGRNIGTNQVQGDLRLRKEASCTRSIARAREMSYTAGTNNPKWSPSESSFQEIESFMEQAITKVFCTSPEITHNALFAFAGQLANSDHFHIPDYNHRALRLYTRHGVHKTASE